MQHVFPWLAFGVGALALANALLRSGSRRLPYTAWLCITVAAGILVLAALLTLPVEPPFSRGQTLGVGLLLGGIAALLGMLARPPLGTTQDQPGAYLAWSGRIGAPVCGVALLIVLYSHRIFDALSGFTLGALTVGLLVGGGLALAARGGIQKDEQSCGQLARGAEWAALIATVLAAAVYLATFHRSPTGVREWQSLPVLFAAAAALLTAARAVVGAPAGKDLLYDLLLIPIPLLVIGWLTANQFNGSPDFLWVVLVGFGVFGLIAWLDWVAASRGAEGGGVARLDVALITALLALGGSVLAFRELSGYGLALLTLAGVVLYPLALLSDDRNASSGRLYTNALLVGALLALYRMYTERNEYARGFQPDFLYYYVALALGALLPALFAGLAEAA